MSTTESQDIPMQLVGLAEFARYRIYDRAIAEYRKRCGKEAAEEAGSFMFSYDQGRLYFFLVANEKPVAKYHVRPVGNTLMFRLHRVEHTP